MFVIGGFDIAQMLTTKLHAYFNMLAHNLLLYWIYLEQLFSCLQLMLKGQKTYNPELDKQQEYILLIKIRMLNCIHIFRSILPTPVSFIQCYTYVMASRIVV